MKPLGALALTLSLLALTGSTKGQSVVCKTPNIIFGTGASFEYTPPDPLPGPQVGGAGWEYQWQVGACNTAWARMGKDLTDTIVLWPTDFPGTLKVRYTGIYRVGQTPATQTFSPMTSIEVPKPDGIRCIQGNNVATGQGQSIATVFQITSKGTDSLLMHVSHVQERITNSKTPAGPYKLTTTDWSPTAADGPLNQNSRFYFFYPGKIYDLKMIKARGFPPGSTIMTYRQDFRIILKDPCFKDMAPIELGGFNETVKTAPADSTKYLIIH